MAHLAPRSESRQTVNGICCAAPILLSIMALTLVAQGLVQFGGAIPADEGLHAQIFQILMAVQIPLIVAYALSYTVIYSNGANAFYRLLGFLPPTSPIAMPVLYAAGDVPLWQVAVSAVLWAAGHGRRFVGLRVVRVRARERLPQAALCGMRADGSLDAIAVLRALWRRPGDIAGMPSVTRNAWVARSALARARHGLGRGFGLPDLG